MYNLSISLNSLLNDMNSLLDDPNMEKLTATEKAWFIAGLRVLLEEMDIYETKD